MATKVYMKKFQLAALAFCCCLSSGASDKDSTFYYHLPDSVKAVQFMAELNIPSTIRKKGIFAGIMADSVRLLMEIEKKTRKIVLEIPQNATVMVNGIGAEPANKGAVEWKYNWSNNTTYRLLIAIAADSTDNFTLTSGYIWLPVENKWKLIGTCKMTGWRNSMQEPAGFFSSGKNGVSHVLGQAWFQHSNGTWTKMKKDSLSPPVINLYAHLDSARQRLTDNRLIEEAIAAGKTDVKQNENGIYYAMMKEGTGRYVSPEDTVVVHYKGYLLSDGSVFDQTREKPATFPLKRLIRGWQVGVPLCRVGGRIKLVIPSDMAYSIRTRAAKIPPNSILVFEVEVKDTRTP